MSVVCRAVKRWHGAKRTVPWVHKQIDDRCKCNVCTGGARRLGDFRVHGSDEISIPGHALWYNRGGPGCVLVRRGGGGGREEEGPEKGSRPAETQSRGFVLAYHCHGHGVDGRACATAVQALVRKGHRNAQPRVIHKGLLHLVAEREVLGVDA